MQAADHRVGGVQPGQRIGWASGQLRGGVGIAAQPAHAADLLHGLSEAHPVAPRPVESEGRHSHHDQPGVQPVDGLPVETELVHHPGGEVLHQGIGDPDEPVQQLHAFGPGQVEGHRPFAHVGVLEGGRRTPTTGRRLGCGPSRTSCRRAAAPTRCGPRRPPAWPAPGWRRGRPRRRSCPPPGPHRGAGHRAMLRGRCPFGRTETPGLGSALSSASTSSVCWPKQGAGRKATDGWAVLR